MTEPETGSAISGRLSRGSTVLMPWLSLSVSRSVSAWPKQAILSETRHSSMIGNTSVSLKREEYWTPLNTLQVQPTWNSYISGAHNSIINKKPELHWTKMGKEASMTVCNHSNVIYRETNILQPLSIHMSAHNWKLSHVECHNSCPIAYTFLKVNAT